MARFSTLLLTSTDGAGFRPCVLPDDHAWGLEGAWGVFRGVCPLNHCPLVGFLSSQAEEEEDGRQGSTSACECWEGVWAGACGRPWVVSPSSQYPIGNKLKDSFFLQIRELVPESQAYMDLLAFERKLDQTIARKRMEIQEAIKKPLTVCAANYSYPSLPLVWFCFPFCGTNSTKGGSPNLFLGRYLIKL